MTTEIVITIICTVLTAICSYVICRKKCANNIEAQFGEFTSVYPPKVCYVLPCIIMVLELTASIFIFEFNQDVNIWICLTIFILLFTAILSCWYVSIIQSGNSFYAFNSWNGINYKLLGQDNVRYRECSWLFRANQPILYR